MNMPITVAQAQGGNGAKGPAHGIKGGRPRLDLTDGERTKHRRKQQEAWRRRQGIPAKNVRSSRVRPTNWAREYFDVWGKPPGVPLTPEEFAKREPMWNERDDKLAEG
jgi:hypothetical protein